MGSLKYPGLLSMLLSISLIGGCGRVIGRSPDRGGPDGWGEPKWGPPAEGLECRLRPTQGVWRAGQAPTFKVDLRNRGKRMFALVYSDDAPVHEFIVDGRRHRAGTSRVSDGSRVQPLAPGVEFSNLLFHLPGELRLSPGRHRIRVLFLFEGVEVVSNAVEIETLASR